ncbi:MAG: hypothetical protein AAGC86_10595 [Pseudomonadota bacterium]
MTGLLKDLAARFAPQATAPIRPRPAFRFEGEGEADGFHEIAAETRTAAPARDATPPGRFGTAEPASGSAPKLSGPATVIAPAQPVAAARPDTPRDVPQRQETRRPAPKPGPAAQADSATLTGQHVVPAPQAKVERTRTRETVHERIETVRIAQSAPASAERTDPHQSTPPAVPENPRPEAAPGEPASEEMAQPAPPAPTVRIGRIEVRAPAKPAPPPAPPRPAPAPATQTARPAPAPASPMRSGLTDYLGWRR